jgi:glycosyltransferase involved in cell wall biosynthesis
MHEIAVDTGRYPATLWPEPPSLRRPLKVLFVGRLIAAKALPLLLESLRRLRPAFPVELVVAGDGPMRGPWESCAADLGASVVFIGTCSQDEIARRLAESHVLCLPSVRESGGAVLMEAMSAARPVIAVDYGGPAELVDKEVGHLVPALGPESVIEGLTEALSDIFRNPEAWRNRGICGHRRVIAEHTWEKRIQGALGIYEEILNLDVRRTA